MQALQKFTRPNISLCIGDNMEPRGGKTIFSLNYNDLFLPNTKSHLFQFTSPTLQKISFFFSWEKLSILVEGYLDLKIKQCINCLSYSISDAFSSSIKQGTCALLLYQLTSNYILIPFHSLLLPVYTFLYYPNGTATGKNHRVTWCLLSSLLSSLISPSLTSDTSTLMLPCQVQ